MMDINNDEAQQREWYDVAAVDELADGEVRSVSAGGRPIALFRVGEEFFALRDQCTHGRAQLSMGVVVDGCVECPLHQGLFDLRTGAVRGGPPRRAVRTFRVRTVSGRVEIEA
jgi:nitrite reductase/ring-hydroxylating ferredoxin subunit